MKNISVQVVANSSEVLCFQNPRITRAHFRDLKENLKRAWPLLAAVLIWSFVASYCTAYFGAQYGLTETKCIVRQPCDVQISLYSFGSDSLIRPWSSMYSFTMSMYYHLGMLSTVGVSDLTPINFTARLFALLDSFFGLVLLGTLVALIGRSFDGETTVFVGPPLPNVDDKDKAQQTAIGYIALLQAFLARLKIQEARQQAPKSKDRPEKE